MPKLANMLLRSFVLSFLAGITNAALVSNLEFDYVIIGGGTAGSALARRLSEDPSVTVALVEAGGSALQDPLVESIYGFCNACVTSVDWNYTTVAQNYLNGSIQPYHSGKCLGGSSAINGCSDLLFPPDFG